MQQSHAEAEQVVKIHCIVNAQPRFIPIKGLDEEGNLSPCMPASYLVCKPTSRSSAALLA